MHTLLRDAAMPPASSATPTADHLMDAPLPQLLAEYGVTVDELDREPGFTGGAYVRSGDRLFFVKPANRPAMEWEMMARFLLGKALRVPLPDLPEPYEATEF